ncbi:hypothetical protein TSH100_10155 [Azospirillum sp. TSH100]|nr:hypothetical protein TSH100_10155 [Azospirillum sp. TSH100]
MRRDQPAGTFDLLLVGRPPSHQSPIWNAEARRFKAVLVAPAETADRLGRNVTILADGPPRDLTAFNLARRLFPTMASLHLILDRPADPDRVDGWLRWLDCQCPVRVSAARRTTDARIAAILEAGGDLVVVERPARFWKSIGFEWRLPALIDRTPGAMLFTL